MRDSRHKTTTYSIKRHNSGHKVCTCDRTTFVLFCSVLKFGPVPTSPTPLLQGAPVRLSPPLDQWYGVYYCVHDTNTFRNDVKYCIGRSVLLPKIMPCKSQPWPSIMPYHEEQSIKSPPAAASLGSGR